MAVTHMAPTIHDSFRTTSRMDYRRRKSTIGLAGVAMSTSHDPDFMRQAAGLGAMNYLIKPISAETVHSLWLNVFSCRTHTHALAATQSDYINSDLGITRGLDAPFHGNGSPCTPQQEIFQRRIRTDAANGTPTADSRNTPFEEDFIRQFVPAIASTLPSERRSDSKSELGQLTCAMDDSGGSAATELDSIDDGFSSSPRANVLRGRLLEWGFSPYGMDREDMLDSATVMLMDAAACVDLRLQVGRVRRFVRIVESAYYDNPYHNFHHAVDVTQSTFYMLHTLGLFNRAGPRRASLRSPAETSFPLRTILRPTDVMALVVASLCHDLGHPGLNNAFMVRAHTQLAELYNDQSVLENFHAACFSMVMSCYFVDFVLPPACSAGAAFDYDEFRRVAVHAILATDMARHFEFIGKCRAQYERFVAGTNLPLTPQQHEAERAQLAASILKCADISNIVRPFNISQQWTQRLNREVTLQGNIEESLGLPRSIVVDMANVPASQIAFYETCGRPLFNAVADLVPELRYMPDQLENNIRNWAFIMSNQKVPDVPYGLKHPSSYDPKHPVPYDFKHSSSSSHGPKHPSSHDLSISTRAASTDSAPEFLPKPSVAAPLTASTTIDEAATVANYTLHVSRSLSKTTVDDDEDDDDYVPHNARDDLQYMPAPATSPSAAHMFTGPGVSASPPAPHHSTAAT
ncbi:3',5'-cyclic-nucleotide phosphodiesterase [Coemansia sp. RSA 988]|nr:3',5'-cyclic-nucleotide phosphodiesterase [Coemansia sp. RSA 988]